MKKPTLICVLLFIQVFTYSNGYIKTRHQTNSQANTALKINTFTKLPKEIEGCSAYFFLSKKDENRNKYICVNDWAQLAFISIDNRLTKFTLIKNYSIGKTDVYLYKNKSISLTIEVKTKRASGPESSRITGTITVESPGSGKTVLHFLGDTGC